MHEYEETRRVSYGGAVFIPVCPKCGRYVKADASIPVNENASTAQFDGKPNATCKRCGRVEMPCEGWVE